MPDDTQYLQDVLGWLGYWGVRGDHCECLYFYGIPFGTWIP